MTGLLISICEVAVGVTVVEQGNLANAQSELCGIDEMNITCIGARRVVKMLWLRIKTGFIIQCLWSCMGQEIVTPAQNQR